MQILPSVLAAAIAAVSPSSDLKRSDPVLVRAVIDGDTIDVASFGRVRLLGIDAPEIGRGFDTTAPFAKEARDRLAALVLQRWVRLEHESPLVDAYSRRLAYVIREDGLFVNAALARDGLARVSARVPLTRLAELKRAEADAQAFRRGMWGGTPKLPSASYTPPPAGAKRPPASRKKPRAKAGKAKARRSNKSWSRWSRGDNPGRVRFRAQDP